ncbi:hypothetical protein [Flavobacterium branchiicola]|uniref:Uncharacterized protein n=1 Tax=Flavobacterium branchiicola TaxID=1114875 RepID=A0ABV9PCY7_9FLAO|nr:hypothetical protein [Flavobacterium branchiicola]MBS7253629.1 hypothetical protein [Flavobacterium branchiicola]
MIIEDWQDLVAVYEKENDWKALFRYLNIIENKLNEADRLNLCVRIMFLTVYSLLKKSHSQEEEIYGKNKLSVLFNTYFAEFKDDYDFLFCMAVITELNPSAFNVDFIDSDQFLDDSITMSNGIKLYLNWFLVTKKSIYLDRDYLNSEFIKSWEKEKGKLGEYVVEFLKK